MKICKTIAEIRAYIDEVRAKGLTVGFVPTMGYLHEGHLALMRECKKKCDVTVVSIFVNQLQFGPNEDFATYPRDLERDAKLAESVGVDVIFYPDMSEIYPDGYCTYVKVEGLTDKMCGKSRPAFFGGITTVVTKLFNIIRPDYAFFGQKDAQQALVIQRLVKDLHMGLQVVTVPIVRESDGLAMSSRNVYLNPEERQKALVLWRSLQAAKAAFESGERDASKIRNMVWEMISAEPLAQIDYVEIYSMPDLQDVTYVDTPVLLAVAVQMGKTRLIDNIVLGV